MHIYLNQIILGIEMYMYVVQYTFTLFNVHVVQCTLFSVHVHCSMYIVWEEIFCITVTFQYVHVVY